MPPSKQAKNRGTESFGTAVFYFVFGPNEPSKNRFSFESDQLVLEPASTLLAGLLISILRAVGACAALGR